MSFFNAKEETATLNEFSLIEPGTYVATIMACQESEDKYGNDYIKFELELGNGRKYFDNIYLSHPEFDSLVTKSRARLKLYVELHGMEELKSPADLRYLVGAQYRIQMGAYAPKTGGDKRNVINNILPVADDIDPVATFGEDVPAEEPVRPPAASAPRTMARRTPLAVPVRK
jgi:hypothetical protein